MRAPPTCPDCGKAAGLITGAEIWPARRDLADKQLWACQPCGNRVGCHPGTTTPLGTLAGPELRKARELLHERIIDPLWRNAWRDPAYAESQAHPGGGRRANGRDARQARAAINKAARGRVYAFLAERMGLTPDLTHTAMFDLEQCRAAWRVLHGVTFAEIREWARQSEAAQRDERNAA